MIVLGFDTSTSATAVALRGADGSVREARDDPAPGAHPGHATRLLPMAEELLAAAGLGLGAVDRIAVGAGPGTFTGLRVGIATARALAQSRDLELVAVPSLEALARPALAAGGGRAVLAAIDARRREVFAAIFADGGETLAAARPLAPADLGALVAEAAEAAPLAVGDGAVRYRELVAAAGAEPAAEGSPLHLLRASAVCELALTGAATGLEQVVPEYLRRPDAELAAAARGGAG